MNANPNQLALAVAAAMPAPKPKQTRETQSRAMKNAWALRKEAAVRLGCRVHEVLMAVCMKMAYKLETFFGETMKRTITRKLRNGETMTLETCSIDDLLSRRRTKNIPFRKGDGMLNNEFFGRYAGGEIICRSQFYPLVKCLLVKGEQAALKMIENIRFFEFIGETRIETTKNKKGEIIQIAVLDGGGVDVKSGLDYSNSILLKLESWNGFSYARIEDEKC